MFERVTANCSLKFAVNSDLKLSNIKGVPSRGLCYLPGFKNTTDVRMQIVTSFEIKSDGLFHWGTPTVNASEKETVSDCSQSER